MLRFRIPAEQVQIITEDMVSDTTSFGWAYRLGILGVFGAVRVEIESHNVAHMLQVILTLQHETESPGDLRSGGRRVRILAFAWSHDPSVLGSGCRASCSQQRETTLTTLGRHQRGGV